MATDSIEVTTTGPEAVNVTLPTAIVVTVEISSAESPTAEINVTIPSLGSVDVTLPSQETTDVTVESPGINSVFVDVTSSPTSDGRIPSTTESDSVIAIRTATIQSALNQDGVIHLKDGVYVIGQLIIPTKGGIIGQSHKRTVLFAKNDFNDDLIVATDHATYKGTYASQGRFTGPDNIELRNLTVDGNPKVINGEFTDTGSNNTTVSCIHLFAWNVHVENVRIFGATGVGIDNAVGGGLVIENGKNSQTPPGNWNNRDVMSGATIILDVEVFNCYRGMDIYGSDFQILNYNIADTEREGIRLTGAANQISGHTWGCCRDSVEGGAYYGSVDVNGYILCDHIQLDNNYGVGLRINGNYNSIGHIRTIHGGGRNDHPTILVEANRTNLTIGTVDGYLNVDQPGIDIEENCTQIIIRNCQLRGRNLTVPPVSGFAPYIIRNLGNQCEFHGNFSGADTGILIGDGTHDVSNNIVEGNFYGCTTGVTTYLDRGNKITCRYQDSTVPTPVDEQTETGIDNTIETRSF